MNILDYIKVDKDISPKFGHLSFEHSSQEQKIIF